MRQILFLLLVSYQVLANPVLAARPYNIELLVFTIEGDASGSKLWKNEPGAFDWDDSRRLNGSQLLSRGGRLSAEKYSLQRHSSKFEPVIHAAWHQAVQGRDSARAWYMKSDRDIVPGTPVVEGLVKISVGRYLHAEFDFLIRERSDDPIDAVGGFKNYRFTGHRRMRSGELHYIDHPLLGVLIEITPG